MIYLRAVTSELEEWTGLWKRGGCPHAPSEKACKLWRGDQSPGGVCTILLHSPTPAPNFSSKGSKEPLTIHGDNGLLQLSAPLDWLRASVIF